MRYIPPTITALFVLLITALLICGPVNPLVAVGIITLLICDTIIICDIFRAV